MAERDDDGKSSRRLRHYWLAGWSKSGLVAGVVVAIHGWTDLDEGEGLRQLGFGGSSSGWQWCYFAGVVGVGEEGGGGVRRCAVRLLGKKSGEEGRGVMLLRRSQWRATVRGLVGGCLVLFG
ncbi:hypothetical protein HAX54_040843 [Datura stramonium]|uniref:Uncharacterized protein n=1 Tax=Datura stramonium TaxID=4076 RepID=A0ABS8VN74_DATST|nr:hypothetical protein [Datura stramonium]